MELRLRVCLLFSEDYFSLGRRDLQFLQNMGVRHMMRKSFLVAL